MAGWHREPDDGLAGCWKTPPAYFGSALSGSYVAANRHPEAACYPLRVASGSRSRLDNRFEEAAENADKGKS